MKNHTRSDILEAYNKLIRKNSMDKLTVEMIITEAQISKATFYRYFMDKYDVMNYNYKLLLDRLSAPDYSHGYQELYEHLYTYARDNWKFLQNAFDTVGKNSFCDFIASYSMNTVIEITKQNRGGKGLTAAEILQCDVFTIGISYMYRDWIYGKYPLSPQEAAEALYGIMPETLKEMWWTN